MGGGSAPLTEIHVIGNKARNLKIHQELIVHMLLSAILELSENVWLYAMTVLMYAQRRMCKLN